MVYEVTIITSLVGLILLIGVVSANKTDKPTKNVRISLVFVVLAAFMIGATSYGTYALSAVRAYITAEGLWAKAQKEAAQHLLEYNSTGKEIHFNNYKQKLQLQHNFSRTRKTLISDMPDIELAKSGFRASALSPKDIEMMIWLAVNFKKLPYMSQALHIWKLGDQQIANLHSIAQKLHQSIHSGQFSPEDRKAFSKAILAIDQRLTQLENSFSATLNEGAHWIRRLIFWITISSGGLLTLLGYVITTHQIKKISNLNRELEQLSLVASKTTDIVIITDSRERITWVNKTFEHITGYCLEEIRGNIPGQLLQGHETDPDCANRLAKAVRNRESIRERILNYSKEGEKYWVDMKIDPIFDKYGNCTHFIAIERDVTEQVKQEAEVRENLERYNIVSRATSDTIWDLNLQTDVIHYNDVIYDMFGYSQTEVNEAADWWRDKIHPADQAQVRNKLKQAIQGNKDRIQFGYRFKCADGCYKYIYDRAFVVTDKEGKAVRIIGAMQDVTSQKLAREKINQALKEKETLLAEVHHRVKNNMAVVSGMIQLQAFQESNDNVKKKLLDNVARIGTMATIHEHLYQSENFSALNFSENLNTIINKLVNTFSCDTDISVDTSFEPVKLNVNQAIPCSLIVNEVVTNALKHAFKGRTKGKIQLSLSRDGDQLILVIKDNGIGFTKQYDPLCQKESLGIHLIDKLSKQLNAEYNYNSSEKGSRFYLRFKKLDIKGAGSAYLSKIF